MTFQNRVPALPQPIPGCFSGSPTPLSRGAASLRIAEPKGQAVPRGGELRAVMGLGDAGRLAWRLSGEVSRQMSKLGPCRWPHWMAGGAVPGLQSETPSRTQRRPLSGSSALHLPRTAGLGGLGGLR